MDAIRIKNLRSLADTGKVGLRPLTLLVGGNSSGKSTFLRTFPLLRQSVEARTAGPILWYGRFVDFGDFGDALRNEAKPAVITLEFEFSLALRSYSIGDLRDGLEVFLGVQRTQIEPVKRDIRVRVDLVHNEHSAGTTVSACELSLGGNEISCKLDERGRVRKLTVNRLDVLEQGARFAAQRTGAVLPIVEELVKHGSTVDTIDNYVEPSVSEYRHRRPKSRIWEALYKEVGKLTSSNSSKRIEHTINSFLIDSDTHLLDSMQNGGVGTKTWQRNAAGWTPAAVEFKKVRDLSIALVLPTLLRAADFYLASYFRHVTYSKPLRAVTERYYRPQNLAVEEVDPEGTNLPMFLFNLSRIDKQKFQDWTSRHLGLIVSAEASGGHLSLKVRDEASGKEHNLADMGFGLSQVLPIMAQIWSLTHAARKRRTSVFRTPTPLTFVIEQPELHLHPGLQAKVVDLFLDTIDAARERGLELRLIVETHSETMINRIGHRISETGLDPNEVQIVLFEQARRDCSDVRLVDYSEEGFLMNWPYGFFEPEIV